MNTTFLVLAGLPLIVGVGILGLLLALTRIMPAAPRKGTQLVRKIVPMRGPLFDKFTPQRMAAFRLGMGILLGLAALTLVEFYVSSWNSLVLMIIIALAKAGLILYFFMHVTSVLNEEAH